MRKILAVPNRRYLRMPEDFLMIAPDEADSLLPLGLGRRLPPPLRDEPGGSKVSKSNISLQAGQATRVNYWATPSPDQRYVASAYIRSRVSDGPYRVLDQLSPALLPPQFRKLVADLFPPRTKRSLPLRLSSRRNAFKSGGCAGIFVFEGNFHIALVDLGHMILASRLACQGLSICRARARETQALSSISLLRGCGTLPLSGQRR